MIFSTRRHAAHRSLNNMAPNDTRNRLCDSIPEACAPKHALCFLCLALRMHCFAYIITLLCFLKPLLSIALCLYYFFVLLCDLEACLKPLLSIALCLRPKLVCAMPVKRRANRAAAHAQWKGSSSPGKPASKQTAVPSLSQCLHRRCSKPTASRKPQC